MTEIEIVRRAALALPQKLLRKSGGILYSGGSTLRQGDLYFLGVNPGGKAEGAATIDVTITKAIEELGSNHNAYLDECWEVRGHHYTCGQAPFQRRVKHLLEGIGYSVREICASNLVFARTATEAELEQDLTDICWPVHEAILEVVQPRAIITIGIKPYQHVRRKCLEVHDTDLILARHGNWICETFVGTLQGRRTRIIRVPHLARYAIDTKNRRYVIEWVRSLI